MLHAGEAIAARLRRRFARAHDDDLSGFGADLRGNIAHYGVRGIDARPAGAPSGFERRAGVDRRRRNEFVFPDRRSGLDRRAEAARAGATVA